MANDYEWPVSLDEREHLGRRIDAVGKDTARRLLNRRGYSKFRYVVPELRESVMAGIEYDARSGR